MRANRNCVRCPLDITQEYRPRNLSPLDHTFFGDRAVVQVKPSGSPYQTVWRLNRVLRADSLTFPVLRRWARNASRARSVKVVKECWRAARRLRAERIE